MKVLRGNVSGRRKGVRKEMGKESREAGGVRLVNKWSRSLSLVQLSRHGAYKPAPHAEKVMPAERCLSAFCILND